MAHVQTRALSELARQCEKETSQFFQKQGGATHNCLELMRRAISERDEKAWELVYQQYQNLVQHWIQLHPAWPNTGESADYFVNLAFTRFWQALTPEKFAKFRQLNELLQYLKACVHSVIIDYLRTQAARTYEIIDDTLLQQDGGHQRPDLEQKVMREAHQKEIWEQIAARLHSDKERLIVEYCYALEMKPREVYQQHPEIYQSVVEIYRIKGNILERLKRDKNLKILLENAVKTDF